MTRTDLNRMLFVLIAILAPLAWFLRRDVSQPNFVFAPAEMVYSIPYDSFAANPNYTDRKTLQLPVKGTVARGAMFFDYEATEADALRAGEELTSPWSEVGIDADALLSAKDRGRKIFSTFCLPCHGAVGNGDGPVAMHGFPPPPPLSAEKSLKMSDGQMFHVLTFGQKNMPGYAAQVAAADRWKAILHVRAMQETAVRKAEAEQELLASIEVGKKAFERLNCHKCHTTVPGEIPAGPDLRTVSYVYTREQLLDAITKPSKAIAAGFVGQLFLTIDGVVHSGIVINETEDEITLRNAQGNDVVLVVEDIEVRRTLEKSAMPEDLIKDVSDDEVQSLLDYLKSIAVKPVLGAPLPGASVPGTPEAGTPASGGENSDQASDQSDDQDETKP